MGQISSAYKALLSLLRIGINTKRDDFNFDVLTEQEWLSLMGESVNHAVALLSFDSLKGVSSRIPESVKTQWRDIAVNVFSQNFKVLDAQSELVKILEKNEINYIILKGMASASYYPDFEKRSFGDVDFLIAPFQKEKVEKVLSTNGYTCTLKDYVCHSVFEKGGVQFEMHYEIVGIPDGECGAIFREYMLDAEKKGFKNDSPAFQNPIHKIHAVVLLLHTIHHLIDEGIGLRHLCDWACFIEKTHAEPFWQEEIYPLLKKTGTLKFASILTKTASLYLGCACLDWAQDADDKICEALVCDILELGNFGRANGTRSISGKVISDRLANNLKNNKLKYFKEKVSSLYKKSVVLSKKKVFRPFVFLWMLMKTVVLMIFKKKTSLLKTYSYANERNGIYKTFELFDTGNI